jgi:hypothetical protein
MRFYNQSSRGVRRAILLSVACAGISLSPTAVSADIIAYDAISGSGGDIWYGRVSPLADDTTLDPAAGLLITSVTIRLWNAISKISLSADVHVSIYTDRAGVPDALLTQATIPLFLPPRTAIDLAVDLPDVLAPSERIWTAYDFRVYDGVPPVVEVNRTTVVGSSTSHVKYRTATGVWSDTEFDGAALQIRTVPAIGAGESLLAITGLVAFRARRRKAS